MPVRLALAFHNHQPVGNFDSVFADAVARCYRPFLDALARHPGVRLSMHWSGPLYEWLEEHDAAVLDRLGALVSSGQVELLTGPFYEPILPAIPPWDQQGQFARTSEYLKRRFGVEAEGAWIPERVWEPDLPDMLARSGVRYTLLDDHHFLLAGLSPPELRTPFWVESTLGRVGVFPIEKELRYRIPFAPVPDLLDYLESSAGPARELRIFGDDGEKFGVWPKTHEWVYRDGWLEAWLSALEEGSRVQSLSLREAWDAFPPSRSTALPAASYPEMMHWALPPNAQVEVEEAERWLTQQGRGDLGLRLAGGSWRAFLVRYSEARRAHRRATVVSGRIEHLGRSCLGGPLYEEARREIQRAECNCAYWHGVFGGIYLPHLRQAVQEHTIRAESMADRLQGYPDAWVAERDGSEIRFRSPSAVLAVDLEQDGDIVEIAWRPRPFRFTDVIARRPEAYHAKLREQTSAAGAAGADADAPDTIHGAIHAKERGLVNLLEYDARPRSACQEWVVSAGDAASVSFLRAGLLEAETARYRLAGTEPGGRSGGGAAVELDARIPGASATTRSIRKRIAAGPGADEFQVSLDARLPEGQWLVSEWNLGLLTPDAPGRRLVLEGAEPGAYAPGSRGTAQGVSTLRLEDTEWLRMAITLTLQPPARVEWAPIETVSLSESGAERIYQGTSFLLGWRAAVGELQGAIAVRLAETARAD